VARRCCCPRQIVEGRHAEPATRVERTQGRTLSDGADISVFSMGRWALGPAQLGELFLGKDVATECLGFAPIVVVAAPPK
jgi:hypothetical protein